MKYIILTLAALLAVSPALGADTPAADPAAELSQSIQDYFNTCFADLKSVAEQIPTEDTFRAAMAPVAEKTEGFFGGTLINEDFVIQQVFFKRNFLARGFDLKKVEQLDRFWNLMQSNPAPQLSEPARGNLMQPRLVAMRYPIVKDGKLINIISMMVRTEAFLKATGLDQRPAYSIACDGIQSEKEGVLSDSPREITLQLPSTQWVIRFD